jgi:hypothetical protein
MNVEKNIQKSKQILEECDAVPIASVTLDAML